MIGIIVAYSTNRVIGKDGTIPWNIEGEKKRFKELTTGNIVVMGRKTYEDIGHPLPARMNVVVSTTKQYKGENLETVTSLKEAIDMYKDSGKKIYIAGGRRLYKEALEYAEKLYVTHIDKEIEGDVYFPEFDTGDYVLETEKEVEGDIPYRYVTYTKKGTKL